MDGSHAHRPPSKAGGGNKWFSLIDKAASERNLGFAWEKVADNAGACGVGRVTIGHFGKASQKRLLAVKEHLSKGDHQAQPIQRVEIRKAGRKEPERSGHGVPGGEPPEG
jgi:hypothetical protein